MLSAQPLKIDTSKPFRRAEEPHPQYLVFLVTQALATTIMKLAAVIACTNAVSREPVWNLIDGIWHAGLNSYVFFTPLLKFFPRLQVFRVLLFIKRINDHSNQYSNFALWKGEYLRFLRIPPSVNTCFQFNDEQFHRWNLNCLRHSSNATFTLPSTNRIISGKLWQSFLWYLLSHLISLQNALVSGDGLDFNRRFIFAQKLTCSRLCKK
jgi:hypothetical protein